MNQPRLMHILILSVLKSGVNVFRELHLYIIYYDVVLPPMDQTKTYEKINESHFNFRLQDSRRSFLL